MADQVLYSGVACITDLMVKEGLINLDFADVRAVMREMGKAMMGTGEASGEKRALRAAEAAISNPLIDDVSMRGAKGLLISITGGNDLTLYEVDEAATRIREEVDQEANIIVGATFDQSLEGIIRVSVVATGVDAAVAPRSAAPQEARIAEATQRIRADVPRANQEVRPAAPAPMTAAAPPNAAPQGRPSPAAIQAQATAAVAAALMPRTGGDDLTIRPIPPKPSLFVETPAQETAVEPPPPPKTFIPPQPERPQSRPRMPRIDELPIPAQNQLRARERTESAEDPLEKPRMSLLQRLASVGLGRKEAEGEPQQQREAAPPRPVPMPERPRPVQRLPDANPPEPVSEFAKRTPSLGLDFDRASPPQSADDQLDIPAFLRRQAN
jgi:cell division protein FtsZ